MAKSRKRLNRRGTHRKRNRGNPLELDGLFDVLVNDSWHPESPEILYHYTDWDGARGILCGQHIWETAHNCTNDKAEIKSAHSVILEVAKSLRKTAVGATAQVLDLFIDTYPRLQLDKLKTIYLSCFSLSRDDEKQWQKYADDGRGLCLALRVLKEPSPTPRDRASALIQVDYSEESWRNHLTSNFKQICALSSRAVISKRNLGLASSALYRIAAFGSIMAKKTEWAIEREVRHVTFLRNDAKAKPKERTRGDKIVRYLDDVDLRVGGKHLAFSEIVIGPNQDFNEAQHRLVTLLDDAGYQAGAFEYPIIRGSQVQPWKQKAVAQ